jgi:hypothetical protein
MAFQEAARASICVSAPYAESAIMALASRASSQGLLDCIYMPSKALVRFVADAGRLLGVKTITKRLQRPKAGVPQLREITPLLEPQRMIMRILRGGRLTDRYTYKYKGDLIAQFALTICQIAK